MRTARFLLLLLTFAACTVTRGVAQLPAAEELVQASLIADTTAVAAGKPFTAGVVMKLKAGWHTYWKFPGDSGGAPRLEWKLPEGFTAGPIQWPLPHSREDEGDLLSYVYEGELLLPVTITPPATLPTGPLTFAATLNWLACEQTCIPGKSEISLSLPAGTDAPANEQIFAKWRSELPMAGPAPLTATWDFSDPKQIVIAVTGLPPDFKLEFFPVPPQGIVAAHPKVGPVSTDGNRQVTLPTDGDIGDKAAWSGLFVTQQGDKPRQGWEVPAGGTAAVSPGATTTTAPSATPVQGLLGMLGLAFLGGLVLNVMPCVLPVIALKIFGFLNQAKESPARVRRLGLAFAAGVFAFFLALAIAVIVLKAAGSGLNWGFQFQNPFLLAGMIALIYVFALNMLGVFEITLAGGAATKLNELSTKEGYGGAFTHGLFTTLLGTSCTAPFLGTSLGYAVTQPWWAVLLLFFMIAAGMSLPYVALTAHPAWMRYLPKPGVWMERVKQLLGFAVLGVVVWLVGVLGTSRGAETVSAMLWYLLALGVASWAFGVSRHRVVSWAVVLVVAIGGYYALLHAPLKDSLAGGKSERALSVAGGIPWQPYSEEALASALAAGQPVFIDFTADWCLNCKVYERVVLETDPVRGAFREKNVLALKADYTNEDPVIKAALAKLNRISVPLYVLHRPGEPTPLVQDGLTQEGLLQEIGKIAGASPALADAKAPASR